MVLNVLDHPFNGSVQAALNAARPRGGAVYAPAGNYAVDPLVAYTDTLLYGDGAATILTATGSNGSGVITSAPGAQCVNVRDLRINGNGQPGTRHGIYLANGANPGLHRVENVTIWDASRDGVHLGMVEMEAHVINCFTYNCQRSGFFTEVGATDSKIIGCTAAGSKSHGFYIGGNTTHYSACKSYYSGAIPGADQGTVAGWTDASGFYLAPAAGQHLSRVWLTSCEAQNNATNGFFLDGSAPGAQIDHCSFSDCAADGDNVRNDYGAGFKVYHAITSLFTNVNTNIGTNSTNSKINYGLALFGDLSGSNFVNCHFEGGVGQRYTDKSAAGSYQFTACP